MTEDEAYRRMGDDLTEDEAYRRMGDDLTEVAGSQTGQLEVIFYFLSC